MKKILIIQLLLVSAALGGFAQSGVIEAITGTVELKKAGASGFEKAAVGSEVARNTIVSTGFKSTALIKAGGSVIMVRPLTRLTLAEISSAQGKEEINVNLQTGRVRVDANPPAGGTTNFTVSSPSATASVRGTSFDFGARRLRVHRGEVAFRGSRGGNVLVSAGSESRVNGRDGKAADPGDLNNAGLMPPPPPGAENGGTNNDVSPTSSAPGPTADLDLSITIHFE